MRGHSSGRIFGSQRRSSSWSARRYGWGGGWGWWGGSGFADDAPPSQPISSQLTSSIQSCLAQVIGNWVPQTGRFGRATRYAVRSFQMRQGLPATGYPDARTVSQLHDACSSRQGSPTQDPVDSPEMVSGELESSPSTPGCNEDRCTSTYIAWVQTSLNGLGNRLQVTGQLDRSTIKAINKFKAQNNVQAKQYYASPLIEQALIRAGASAPPPVRRLPCGPTPAAKLLPLLRQYAGDIPVEYLLGWINVESGFKLGDLTKVCERGYFQIGAEEAHDRGIPDFDRTSIDPDYSIQVGLKQVRGYAARAKALAAQFNLNLSPDFFWALAKLHHWIPSGPFRLLTRMRGDGVPITDWPSIYTYVHSKPPGYFGGLDARQGVDSVEHYLRKVNDWRRTPVSGVPATIVAPAPGPTSRPPAGPSATPPPSGGLFSMSGVIEVAMIRSSIQQGERDANKLTDLIFNRRHPERRGQLLRRDEEPLVSEWLDIQARLVLPVLQAAPQLASPAPPQKADPAPAPLPLPSPATQPVPVQSVSKPGAKPRSTTSGIEASEIMTRLIPCLLKLQDKGRKISFVQRYLRNLTRKEVAALKGAGFTIVSCYEVGNKAYGPTLPGYFTRTQGQLDARRGFAQAQAVGQPADTPIYFTVDTDPFDVRKQNLLDYVRGLADGYAQYLNDMKAQNKQPVTYAIGMYGGELVVDWCKAQGLASWFWQSFAWNPSRKIRMDTNIHTTGIDTPMRCGLKLGYLEGWGNEGGW